MVLTGTEAYKLLKLDVAMAEVEADPMVDRDFPWNAFPETIV